MQFEHRVSQDIEDAIAGQRRANRPEITCFGLVPVMMNPPMPMLLPV